VPECVEFREIGAPVDWLRISQNRFCAEINTFPTNISVIHINELACAKVMCEIPGDFRPRAKPKRRDRLP
jgi:hypothetical protein